MYTARVIRGFAIACCVATTTLAAADPKVDPCACSPVRPGFFKRDTLLGDFNGLRDDLHDDGIIVSGTYASEFFVGPGLQKKAVFAGLAVLAVDADLSTLVNERLGAMHVSGLGIHGSGLSTELMDVYGVS